MTWTTCWASTMQTNAKQILRNRVSMAVGMATRITQHFKELANAVYRAGHTGEHEDCELCGMITQIKGAKSEESE